MNPSLAGLIGRHLAAENAQDLPGTLATLHPDCRFEDLATGQTWHGHDGAAARCCNPVRAGIGSAPIWRNSEARSYWKRSLSIRPSLNDRTTTKGCTMVRPVGAMPRKGPICLPCQVASAI